MPLKNISTVDSWVSYYDKAKEMMEDIKNSTAVYVGAPNRDLQYDYFIGKDKTYVGQPDYIFLNNKTKKYFIVEEKFHYVPRAFNNRVWASKFGHDVERRKNQKFCELF